MIILSVTSVPKLVVGRGEDELVGLVLRVGALGDPGLDVLLLDPLGEPAHLAVAEQRVRAQSPGKSSETVKIRSCMRT